MGAEKNTEGEFCNFQFRNAPCPNLGTKRTFAPRLQHRMLHKKINAELRYYNTAQRNTALAASKHAL